MKKILFFSFTLLGLTALTALAEEGKCPISGKPCDPNVSINVNGKKVSFCCEKCQASLEKKLNVTDNGPGQCPMSGKAASKEACVLQSVTEAVYFCCNKCESKYTKQNNIEVKDEGPGKCPVSGEAAEASNFVVENGKKVYFCCAKCQKKYTKENNVVMVDKGPGKCPLSGEEAEKEHVVYHTKTKAVYFCCDKCAEKFVSKEISSKL